MNGILQNIADVQAVNQANEDNMGAFWLDYARSSGREANDGSNLLRFATGLPVPLFNGVFKAQLEGTDVDAIIEEESHYFKTRHVPAFWWVSPLNRPADLGTRLQQHGFIHASTVPGMAVELAALPDSIPVPQGFTIEVINDVVALRSWTEILLSVHGIPLSLLDAFVDLELQRGMNSDAVYRRYLGRYNGQPVTTSVLYLAAGVAGLQSVATLPQARGKGFGAAISLQPMLDGRAEGYHVGTLQASQMGHPIYQRLGFEVLCQFDMYFLPA